MPQYYTLEDAARLLGMSPDELKTLAQQKKIRAFMDGGSWRFKQADIDEESRRRGMGSEPELPLSDLDLDAASDLDIDLTEFQIGVAPADLAAPSVSDMDPVDAGSDDQILIDERNTPPSPSGSSSTIIGMHSSTKGKKPSDSDVRLVPDKPNRSASDSDVRLGPTSSSASGIKPPRIGRAASDSDVTLVNEEAGSSREVQSVSHDDEDPNATLLQPSPVLSSSDDLDSIEGTSDSDFELTPSSVIDALEPESGSDFELTALDASDEFDTAPVRRPSDSDVTGPLGSASGLNLSRPSDSGINLQSVGNLDMASADSIELAPLDEDADEKPTPVKAKPAASAQKPTAKKPAAKKEEPVDLSATALPIRADKDIFDDTDFDVDVDAIDSSEEDRTVQLEAQSDFDVEDDSGDSASEIFAIDEEEVDSNAATAMGPAVFNEDEDEEGEGISGEVESAWDVEEVATPSTASRSIPSPLVASGGPTAEWGGLWVALLAVASVFMMLLAFVGMDLVRNLYYFQGDTPASGLIKTIAGMIGG